MESPIEAQRLVYGDEKGPPMIYEVLEPPTRPTKRRKVDSNKRETDHLLTLIRQRKKMMEKSAPETVASPSLLPGDFPPELGFRALAAYSLLRTLSIHLRLSPFTPNAFLRALYLPYPNKLIGKIHVSLLRVLLPQLHMGFSYKAKGGVMGSHKRRHIDNVRWPLLAGDNLTFLDRFTWPLFYDDYCHLTADRLWKSLHDEQLHLDFRNAELKDIGINDYEGTDIEEEEEPIAPSFQQWSAANIRSGPGTSMMMHFPPSKEPQVPISLDRSSRRARKSDKKVTIDLDNSETESEYESDEEYEEAWVPGKNKRKRNRQKISTTPSKPSVISKPAKRTNSSRKNQSNLQRKAPTTASKKQSKSPPTGAKSKKISPKLATTTATPNVQGKSKWKIRKSIAAKSVPKKSNKKVVEAKSTIASLSTHPVSAQESKNAASSFVPPPPSSTAQPQPQPGSKVFDIESTVPEMLSESDKLQRSSPSNSILPFSTSTKMTTKRKEVLHSGTKACDNKGSKVLDLFIVKPAVVSSSASIPPAVSTPGVCEKQSTEICQNTTSENKCGSAPASASGSETEEEEEDIFENMPKFKNSQEVKSSPDENKDVPRTTSITKAADSIPSQSQAQRLGNDESLQSGTFVNLPGKDKTLSSAAAKVVTSEYRTHKEGVEISPQTNHPRGRSSMKLPMHSSKPSLPLSTSRSAPGQYYYGGGTQGSNFAPPHPHLYQQQMMQQQRMMQLHEQQMMMQLQAKQQRINMHQFQLVQQMQQQQQLQHFQGKQVGMQGGLRGHFSASAINGNFGRRQQQKALSMLQSYGGGGPSATFGHGTAPSMMNPHAGKGTAYGHEKKNLLKSKGLEVSEDIAAALQKFACGIDLDRPTESESKKEADHGENNDVDLSFESKLDEHRWAHFEPLKQLRSGIPYYRLPVEQKLVILEFLIDELLQLDFIAAEFTHRHNVADSNSRPYGVLPSEEEFKDLENDDECAICGGEGELLCCDGCVRSYHRQCLDMSPGQALPDGKWLCTECQHVDPAGFGTLRGGKKASLDWFTVDDIQHGIEQKEEKVNQLSFSPGLSATGSNYTGSGMADNMSALGRSAQIQSGTGNNGQHLAGLNTIVEGTSGDSNRPKILASDLAYKNTVQQSRVASMVEGSLPKSNNNTGSYSASYFSGDSAPASIAEMQKMHPSAQWAGLSTTVANFPQASQLPVTYANGPAFSMPPSPMPGGGSTASLPPASLAATGKMQDTVTMQSHPSAAVGDRSITVANSGGGEISTEDKSYSSKGIEFIVIHGYVFARKSSTGSFAATSLIDSEGQGEGVRSQLHLVLKRDEVEKYLEGMGSKISQAWPLVQIPLRDKSFGDHFPSAKVYLNPLSSFDPSFYTNKYRKAPIPLFMHAGGGAHLVRLMSSDFESECSPLNTYKLTDAMMRDFSFDKDVVLCLRNQVSLFDPYQFIKGYLMKLETSLRKACLLSEFWEAGKEKSRRDIWEINLRKTKSVNRIGDLLLKLVDVMHPRAFSEGWFHNPLLKNTDNSESKLLDLPFDWNATSELKKRKWERTEPEKLLHTAMKEGCSLDRFVKGIRADLLEPMGVVISKRKKPKPVGTSLHIAQKIDNAIETKIQPTSSPAAAIMDIGVVGDGKSSCVEVPNSKPIPTEERKISFETPHDGFSSLSQMKAEDTEITANRQNANPTERSESTRNSQPETDAASRKAQSTGSGGPVNTSHPTTAEKPSLEGKDVDLEMSKVNAKKNGNDGDSNSAENASETEKSGRNSKTPAKKTTEPLNKTGRTRRSGRLTRHAADRPGPEPTSNVKAATEQRMGIEYEIEKLKESKKAKIEKIVKGPLHRDVVWPVAGRLPFATVGNLSTSEMKRLARNAGVVQASHVSYKTSHEVGQVCYAHMWRKRIEQCTGLEELVLLIRVFESFLERPTIHSCETLLRRINSRKAHLQKTVSCSHRDPLTGTLEYFVINTTRNRDRGCWVSYEHIELLTLIAELHRRREIHNNKRLEYLRAQEVIKKARLEKERAEKAAEAKRAAEARKVAEKAAKEAARAKKEAQRIAAAAKAKEAAEKKAAAEKKEAERRIEETKWSKKLQSILSQHQMDTVIHNSACSPDVQAQIRAKTLNHLRVVAEGLRKCNFPMSEKQLTSLLDSTETRAYESIRRANRTVTAGSGHPSSGAPPRTAAGATQPNMMSQATMASNSNVWPTQGLQHNQFNQNTNSFNAYSPANALYQQYGNNVNNMRKEPNRKRQQTPEANSTPASKKRSKNMAPTVASTGVLPTGFGANVYSPMGSMDISPHQQSGSITLTQATSQGQTPVSGLWQQPAYGSGANMNIQNEPATQGTSWDQNALYGDGAANQMAAPRPIDQSLVGGYDLNQTTAAFEPSPIGTPQVSGGSQTVGNYQYQQHGHGQFLVGQNPYSSNNVPISSFIHSTSQQQGSSASTRRQPGLEPNAQREIDPLLSHYPTQTQHQVTQQRQYQQNQPTQPYSSHQHHLSDQGGQQVYVQGHQRQQQQQALPSQQQQGVQDLQQQLEHLQRLQQQQYGQQFNKTQHQHYY